MTITEWVLWILLVCSLIVCLWEEYTIYKKTDELADEMDYSEWLERHLYDDVVGGEPEYDSQGDYESYKRSLWAEYYVSAGWERVENDA